MKSPPPYVSLLVVFAIFAAYSAVHAPIPAAGEPHYLAKAKHFYDPAWCAGDLFLESSNAHWVFYATVGLLTRWMSLDTVAWMGRAIGLFLVAFGWTALVARVTGRAASAVFAAIIYIAIASIGNFSGEWLLDGIEGKVFAYGFLFAAAAFWLDGRSMPAAVAAGLGVSFHPIVGIWGLAAAAFAQCVMWWRMRGERPQGRGASERITCWKEPFPHVGWTAGLLSAALLTLCSLPGLIPAFASLRGGSAFAADYIQVFYRLPHHLDPTTISFAAWIGYALLLGAWVVVRGYVASDRSGRRVADRWLAWVVVGSVLVAAAGVAVGWGPRPARPENMPLLAQRMRLMKFYPFRLVDLLVPMAVSIALAQAAERWRRGGVDSGDVGAREERKDRERENRLTPPPPPPPCEGGEPEAGCASSGADCVHRSRVIGCVAIATVAFGLWNASNTRFRPSVPAAYRADWRAACEWIQEHTPRNSIFMTQRESWAFKWFAERPEYVCFKDCPQDAPGIIEWNRRLKVRHAWFDSEWRETEGYTRAAVERLGAETGVTHLLLRRSIPVEMEPIYLNETYAVYSVSRAQPASGPPLSQGGASRNGVKR